MVILVPDSPNTEDDPARTSSSEPLLHFLFQFHFHLFFLLFPYLYSQSSVFPAKIDPAIYIVPVLSKLPSPKSSTMPESEP